MSNPLITNRYLHQIPVVDLMTTLQSVQINPTELCNRTCSFCPRSNSTVYKNAKQFISKETCKHIGEQLNEFEFKGRVGFVGFGEPLLHKKLPECISIIKKACPTIQWIEVNTNGDFLTKELIEALYNAGCTDLTISMYDSDMSEYFESMCKGISINLTLRHYYDIKNINFIDRLAVIQQKPVNIKRPCYIPFYKLFIDWNGDFLLCDQDWGRRTNQFNISSTTIKDFWSAKINDYRKNLINGNREKNTPCNSCDVNGTIIGQASFDYISHHLGCIDNSAKN